MIRCFKIKEERNNIKASLAEKKREIFIYLYKVSLFETSGTFTLER